MAHVALGPISKLVALVGVDLPAAVKPVRPRVASFRETVLFDVDAESERRERCIGSDIRLHCAVFVCIIASSVVLGIELDQNKGSDLKDRMPYFYADMFFLLVFIFEMFARQHKLGWDYFRSSWNIFDYALVVTNITDVVASADVRHNNRTKIASTIRLVRLLRLAGQVEGIDAFKGMWLLVEGLVQSGRSVVWTGVFTLVILYGFGVVLSTSLGEEAVVFERWENADMYVGSVPRCIFTTLQVFTYDGWITDIVRPLCELGFSPTSLIFVAIVVICNFGILNMVIALMVERLQSMKKAATKLTKVDELLMESLAVEFAKIIQDDDIELDRDQLDDLLRMPEVQYRLRLLGLHRAEASVLFDMLDVDKSGTVSPKEFFSGIARLRGQAMSVDLMKLVSCAMKFKERARQNVVRVRDLGEHIDKIQARLNKVGGQLTGEMAQRSHDISRMKEVWEKAGLRQQVVGRMGHEQRVWFAPLRDPSAMSDLDSVEEHMIGQVFEGGLRIRPEAVR